MVYVLYNILYIDKFQCTMIKRYSVVDILYDKRYILMDSFIVIVSI
jgi:hypothetical protein